MKYYNGSIKQNHVYDAVVDMEISDKDLQQCADAVMRLRADYLFSQKRFDEIEFLYVSGKKLNYLSYLEGKTPNADNPGGYLCLLRHA